MHTVWYSTFPTHTFPASANNQEHKQSPWITLRLVFPGFPRSYSYGSQNALSYITAVLCELYLPYPSIYSSIATGVRRGEMNYIKKVEKMVILLHGTYAIWSGNEVK